MQSAVPILSLLVIFVVINVTNTYDCDDITCGTNEKCKMYEYNDEPICLCKHGYKRNSNMRCVKDKTDCDGVTCGTNEKCTIRNDQPTCCTWCKDGYVKNPRTGECVSEGMFASLEQ